MNSMPSRRKKSTSSKARPANRQLAQARRTRSPLRSAATLRFKETLRPGIERDTQIMPWLVAESVLGEASRWLGTELPAEWADWLDTRAERIYAHHAHFRRNIRSGGNAGRDWLYLFFRHWLASRIKRERRALFRKLPMSYCHGQRLPAVPLRIAA
jgi:hypothetical protein